MNIAALLALLLHSGICAQNEFHGSDGSTLQVVVCPLMQPADTPEQGTPNAEPEDVPDHAPAASLIGDKPTVPERRT
jgi:hypothetical protein